MKFQRQEQQNLKFFDFHAILIQKVFRGFRYRKYFHDFYLRKKALKEIEETDKRVKQQGDEYRQRQIEEMKVSLKFFFEFSE